MNCIFCSRTEKVQEAEEIICGSCIAVFLAMTGEQLKTFYNKLKDQRKKEAMKKLIPK